MPDAADNPRLSLHQLSLYNPGRMPPEQVIAAFAVRGPVLERILADLAAEPPGGRPQHHLVVGQCGMGKTMLLARVAAELRTHATYRERFIPLGFAEEQYSVDRLSRFWLNCLDALADALELARDPTAVKRIDATVARLSANAARSLKDDQPYADEVCAAFLTAAVSTDRRPVLFVDNLQLVFERLESAQQHSLREVLMRPGAPILVGTSASPPAATQDYDAAFYDHFKTHYLRPLTGDEMRDLLLHLAAAAGRDEVRQRVLQHPGRLKILRQLTGGNPRTTIILFFLYAEDFAPTVFGDLEGLLDRVTPHYKARFEALTPQQQVVVSAIATHWDPVTAAALTEAKAAGLPAGTISSQLDRLEKSGVIERVELFGESRIGYQIAERFFNIWFLQRNASRRQRREVEFLTRFLESFYEAPDRQRLAPDLTDEDQSLCEEVARLPESGCPDTRRLHHALVAAHDQNWGLARTALSEALALCADGFPPDSTEDWMRASAVVLHLNYGTELLALLGERGDDARLRPWVEALRALEIGERAALQNISPEIRVTAELIFDDIEKRIKQLPASTRRRPAPASARTRRKK